jgi:hypothetical protein
MFRMISFWLVFAEIFALLSVRGDKLGLRVLALQADTF